MEQLQLGSLELYPVCGIDYIKEFGLQIFVLELKTDLRFPYKFTTILHKIHGDHDDGKKFLFRTFLNISAGHFTIIRCIF